MPSSPSTNVTFGSNATLQAGAGFSLNANRNVSIQSGTTATIDTDGHTVSTAGVITGNGWLTKAGLGRLYLLGSNSYNGGTIIIARHEHQF